VNAFIRSDERIHGVAVVTPTNHREIPGSSPGRYNLQIEITSDGTCVDSTCHHLGATVCVGNGTHIDTHWYGHTDCHYTY